MMMIFNEESVHHHQFRLPDHFTPLDEILTFYNQSSSTTTTTTTDHAANDSSGFEPTNSNSADDDDLLLLEMRERRLKRKASNRESARRSRQRKKCHVDNLNSQLTILTKQNREYKELLTLALCHCHVVFEENKRLVIESVWLQRRLSALNRLRNAKMMLRHHGRF